MKRALHPQDFDAKAGLGSAANGGGSATVSQQRHGIAMTMGRSELFPADRQVGGGDEGRAVAVGMWELWGESLRAQPRL
jgi:hypothetical protein